MWRLSINICNVLSLGVRGSQAECAAQIKGLISTPLTSYAVSSGSGLMGRLCRDSTGAECRLNSKVRPHGSFPTAGLSRSSSRSLPDNLG